MKLFILTLMFLLTVKGQSSVVSPIGYVVTPQGFGSSRFLVVTPENGSTKKNSTTCFEVQSDGKLRKLWELPWYAPRGNVYLHQDGKTVLRLHQIEIYAKTPQEDYGSKIALSFYQDGIFLKSISVNFIVKDLKFIDWSNKYFLPVENVWSSRRFSIEEMGFVIFDETLENKLRKEPIFRILSVDGHNLYFGSAGRLVSRVKRK